MHVYLFILPLQSARREASIRSLSHQADLALRGLVGALVSTVEDAVSPDFAGDLPFGAYTLCSIRSPNVCIFYLLIDDIFCLCRSI